MTPKTIKLSTIKAIHALMQNVADDLTRQSIHGVLVEKHSETELKLTATNGAMLQTVICEDEISKQLQKPFFIPTAHKRILKDALHDVEVLEDFAALKIGPVEIELQPSNYPDTARLWPKEKPKMTVAFNPEYLWSMWNAAKLSKSPEVILEIIDHKKPIVVTVSDQKGLLMPIRLNPKYLTEGVKNV